MVSLPAGMVTFLFMAIEGSAEQAREALIGCLLKSVTY